MITNPNFSFRDTLKISLEKKPGSVFKSMMPIFPRGGMCGFGHSMDYGYLPLFRGIGYKLLLVTVRRKVEQRRLDSEFLS